MIVPAGSFMSHPLLISLIIFVAVFGVIAALGAAISSAKETKRKRTEDLKVLKAALAAPASPTLTGTKVDPAAETLAGAFTPRSQSELAGLKASLAAAGFATSQAVPLYASMRLISLVSGAFAGSAATLFINVPPRYQSLLVVIGLGIGLYAPQIVLKILATRRQKRITRALPDALDLIVISVDVGQGLDASLRRIIAHCSSSSRELCTEFRLFLNHLNMGVPRREALHQLGARAGVPELNSFSAVLAQADRFGSSISESLRSLSESMRIRRRQQAEEKAQQTAVKLIFPLVLFIFPGIFAVLVGPAAISLYRDLCAAN